MGMRVRPLYEDKMKKGATKIYLISTFLHLYKVLLVNHGYLRMDMRKIQVHEELDESH